MNKIIMITAASTLLLSTGAWASENQSSNSAMGCMGSERNPGQNMHYNGLVGKDTRGTNPAQHVAAEHAEYSLGEMIQMMCNNPSDDD